MWARFHDNFYVNCSDKTSPYELEIIPPILDVLRAGNVPIEHRDIPD
jgi:hypothetical protein